MQTEQDGSNRSRPTRRRSTKRGNGEGSIYYDDRLKIWRATVQLGGGKRRYLSGKTRQDVAQKLTVALREVQQGLPAPSQRLTLGQFLDQWMEHSAKPRLKPSTFESYKHYVQRHLKPALGTRPIARLSAQEVQALLNEKAASGLTPRTVQYLNGILRAGPESRGQMADRLPQRGPAGGSTARWPTTDQPAGAR
jgi:integrase